MDKLNRYAMFIGEDGRMGLKNGRIYMVEVESYQPSLNTQHTWQCAVRWVDPDTNDSKWCPYSSESVLRKNWKFIRKEDI